MFGAGDGSQGLCMLGDPSSFSPSSMIITFLHVNIEVSSTGKADILSLVTLEPRHFISFYCVY